MRRSVQSLGHSMSSGQARVLGSHHGDIFNNYITSAQAPAAASSSSSSSSSLFGDVQSASFNTNNSELLRSRLKPKKHLFKLAAWMRKTGNRRKVKSPPHLFEREKNTLLGQIMKEYEKSVLKIGYTIPEQNRPETLKQFGGIRSTLGGASDPSRITEYDNIEEELRLIRKIVRANEIRNGGQQQQAPEEGGAAELEFQEIPLESNRLWQFMEQERQKGEDATRIIEKMTEQDVKERGYTWDEYIGAIRETLRRAEDKYGVDAVAQMDHFDILKGKMRRAMILRQDALVPEEQIPLSENRFVQYMASLRDKSPEELDQIPHILKLGEEFEVADFLEFIDSLDQDTKYDLYCELAPTILEGAAIAAHTGQLGFLDEQSMHLTNTGRAESVQQRLAELKDIMKRADEFYQESVGEKMPDEVATSVVNTLGEFDEMLIRADPDAMGMVQKIRNMKRSYLNTAMRDKIWQMHLENPRYWTGERIGRAVGITREEAWAYLLDREQRESLARGLPFNHNKISKIFANAIQEAREQEFKERNPDVILKKQMGIKKNKKPFGLTLNEEEAYKLFLEETQKAMPSGGGDDLLPDWAKLPFQKPNIIEDNAEKSVPILERFQNQSNLGTDLPRLPIAFMEAKRKGEDVGASQRMLMIKETDGTLRQMSQLEKELAYRKGSIKKTGMGLGGKDKRRRAFRKREF